METIIQSDKDLLIFLNNLGNEFWDPFWLFITNQFNWTPFFLIIFYLIVKSYGWKNGGIIIFSFVILVTFSDQFTNLIKNSVERLRPNNDPDVLKYLRASIFEYKNPQSFSFMSGHATTSTFFTVYLYLLLKRKIGNYLYLIFLFPLIFSYSRLYLGVHYPIDIISGNIIGTSLGILYFIIFKKMNKKLFI